MSDPHRVTEVSILTKSTGPLLWNRSGEHPDEEIKFEMTEDIAHQICTDLDRFLTR
jgi:hypothetical protein